MLAGDAPARTLIEVVGRTLADGAFVFADPDPSPGPCPDAAQRVVLGFAGPQRGYLVVDAPLALGAEIAGNLADDGASIGDELARDALRELANMITGAVLPRLFGDQVVFTLGIPYIARTLAQDTLIPAQTYEAALLSDAGLPIHVRLCFEEDEQVAS